MIALGGHKLTLSSRRSPGSAQVGTASATLRRQVRASSPRSSRLACRASALPPQAVPQADDARPLPRRSALRNLTPKLTSPVRLPARRAASTRGISRSALPDLDSHHRRSPTPPRPSRPADSTFQQSSPGSATRSSTRSVSRVGGRSRASILVRPVPRRVALLPRRTSSADVLPVLARSFVRTSSSHVVENPAAGPFPSSSPSPPPSPDQASASTAAPRTPLLDPVHRASCARHLCYSTAELLVRPAPP